MKQQTEEWFAARLGKVTGSRITDVLAKGKGREEAVTREGYRAELMLERYTRLSQEKTYKSGAMMGGLEAEPHARNAFRFDRGVEVVEVGFIDHPTIPFFGCSPDGLIGDDGGVEFKCPEPAAFSRAMRGEMPARKYLLQCQTNMACTQRGWWELVTYRDGCPLIRVRVSRSEEVIAEIEREVRKFLDEVDRDLDEALRRYPRII